MCSVQRVAVACSGVVICILVDHKKPLIAPVVVFVNEVTACFFLSSSHEAATSMEVASQETVQHEHVLHRYTRSVLGS